MASTDRQAQRDGLYPMQRADWMALSDEKLAAMAIATAQSGIKVLEAAGLDPGDSLRARASGDADEVATYIAHYRRSPADAA